MERHEAEEELRLVIRTRKDRALRTEGFPELFHYTNGKGLVGIVTGNELWMKADNQTRDALELRYSNRVFREVWEQVGGIPGVGLEEANPFAPSEEAPAAYGTYLVAFCEEGDVPHHWQNFASDGRGFSIGFGFQEGAQTWHVRDSPSPSRMWLGPVIYDPLIQRDILRTSIERANTLREAVDPMMLGDALRQVMGELLPFFKHRSFREEKEWRLISTRLVDHTSKAAHIEVIDGALTAVARAKHKGGPALPIRRVIVGPRTPSDAAAHANALLLQNGYRVHATRSGWSLDVAR